MHKNKALQKLLQNSRLQKMEFEDPQKNIPKFNSDNVTKI